MEYSDIYLGNSIYVSARVKQDSFFYHKAKCLSEMIKLSLPFLREHIEFPDHVAFRLATIKGRTLGYYNNFKGFVVIDVKSSFEKTLKIIAHELVHAEQYYQGRLSNQVEFSSPKYVWNGQVYNPVKSSANYKKYRNLPWEVEAFQRQETIAASVHQQIMKKYFSNS